MVIYKFTHIDSGRSYIGQTIQDPVKRMTEHITGSKRSPKEHHFHNALKKYGVEAFTFEVIATASTLEELNLLECKYVDQFDAINNGFNLQQAGNNKLHSEESKKRMSEAQKAAHARRRANNTEGGWTRKDGGPMKGKVSPKKGKESTKWSSDAKARHSIRMKETSGVLGKTWSIIDGKRVYSSKEGN